MKNVFINLAALFLGFISFVFVTGISLVLTALLLVVGLIAKPFILKQRAQRTVQAQVQKSTYKDSGHVYEGKCERVCE